MKKTIEIMAVVLSIIVIFTGCGTKNDGSAEIPLTDASELKYEYDNDLDGIVITDYFGESSKVRIPNTLDNKPVKGIELNDCEKIVEQLIMPDTIVSMHFSDEIAMNLQFINIPAGTINYDSIIKNFPNRFPDGITEDEYYEVILRSFINRFMYFGHLISVDVSMEADRFTASDGILYYNYNGNKVLLYCPPKKTDNFTVQSGVTEIGENAFNGCANLTGIEIPDGVTHIRTGAFSLCTSLTKITLPNRLIQIDEGAFAMCKKLTIINIPTAVSKKYHFFLLPIH